MSRFALMLLVLVLAALILSGCATVLVAGAGAAGYAGYQYEFRSCLARDGRYVSRHWASLHPSLARCFR